MDKFISLELDKEQKDFLETLAKCSQNCGKEKLLLDDVLNAILRVISKYSFDISQISNEKELEENLLSTFKTKK